MLTGIITDFEQTLNIQKSMNFCMLGLAKYDRLLELQRTMLVCG